MRKMPVRRKKQFRTKKTTGGKRNPNRVRAVFHEIEDVYFSGNRSECARKLNEMLHKLRVQGASNYRPSKIDYRKLREIMNDDGPIMYWHLSMFAEFVGVPTSILLLYTKLRATASQAKDAESDSERLKAAHEFDKTIEVLSRIAKTTNRDEGISFSHLKRWAQWFSNEDDNIGPLFSGRPA